MNRPANILILAACVVYACSRLSPAQTNTEPAVQLVSGGFGFLEGPVWDAPNGRLIFSDLRTRRIYRYTPGAAPEIHFDSSNKANGNIVESDGSLLSCEHITHCVARRRPDGSREVLIDSFESRPLNSPNDLVKKSDGTLWFTDPDYGLSGRTKEQAHNNVFVFNPANHELRAVVSDFDRPNGLCFSPDESILYVADSGSPHHIRAFDVTAENQLTNGRLFTVIRPDAPDGIRCDVQGNVWSSAGDGVQVFSPDGTRIRVIPVPEHPANLCFGGASNTTLFITARTSLYAVELP